MSRNVSLAAALATVAVIVPAGWRLLGADIQVDGKHLRPLQQEVTIDGVKVTLDVDRSVVMTGDTVTAKLVAISDTPKTVSVDLRALHSSNYAGERVEQPWSAIDRETIKLTAAPGGGPAVTSQIVLGKRPSKPALTDSFKIMVTKHGTKVGDREYADDEQQSGFSQLKEAGKAAAISITGWSGNNMAISIKAEGPVTLDAPFVIAVRLKNTTGHKLPMHPWVDLSTAEALSATDDPESIAPIQIDRIDEDKLEQGGDDEGWKRGAEHVVRFTVTAHTKSPKQLTFLASAFSTEGPGPNLGGAMDAKTFKVTESTHTVAAK